MAKASVAARVLGSNSTNADLRSYIAGAKIKRVRFIVQQEPPRLLIHRVCCIHVPNKGQPKKRRQIGIVGEEMVAKAIDNLCVNLCVRRSVSDDAPPLDSCIDFICKSFALLSELLSALQYVKTLK